MAAYYNEHDPFAVAWLRELIKANLIADGEVDDRDIQNVSPNDLRGFTQCHFFAGIAGWSYALRLAHWPDDRPVWTGSCPCQPFSIGGTLPAGLPKTRVISGLSGIRSSRSAALQSSLANKLREQVDEAGSILWHLTWRTVFTPLRRPIYQVRSSMRSTSVTVCGGSLPIPTPVTVDAKGSAAASELNQRFNEFNLRNWCNLNQEVAIPSGRHGSVSDGISGRVGRLRGYGNAIKPQVAAAFIQAYLEATACLA